MNCWLYLKERLNAFRVREHDTGRDGDERSCVHSFASRKESALSDLRSLAVLEEALAHERSRVTDCDQTDSVVNESRLLIAAARSSGLFYDVSNIPGVRISLRTGESSVFWNAAEQAYFKIKNPFAKAHLKKHSLSDMLYEHVVHNILFPETRLEFLGIGEELREARFVFRQRAIQSDRRPTDEQIAQALATLGFHPEGRHSFGDSRLFVTDVLASSDNVLLGDDGRSYFIDPIIGFKRPGREVIKSLIG